MRKFPIYSLILVLTLLQACKATAPISNQLNYKDYSVSKSIKQDSAVSKMLNPYADSINGKMNTVIGFAINNLQKKQPESNLGNLMADCLLKQAIIKYNMPIDAAFVNYGGIRSYLPRGEITVGKVYELMPFDNLVVVQKISGKTFTAFLQHIAERGGWPSSGITMKITNKKATEILVAGKPIDENAVYHVVNSDYIANGGDDCTMLKGIPQYNKGYLFREALIEYFTTLTKEGKPIDSPVQNRISNAN